MDEIQAKFLIGTAAFVLFLSYFIPAYQELKKDHDQVVKMVGQYAPADTNTPKQK